MKIIQKKDETSLFIVLEKLCSRIEMFFYHLKHLMRHTKLYDSIHRMEHRFSNYQYYLYYKQYEPNHYAKLTYFRLDRYWFFIDFDKFNHCL